MWKSFVPQDDSTSEGTSETEEDAGETQASYRADMLLNGGGNGENPISGIASRLGTTFWRGITNQSAMDTPPSPESSSRRPSPKPTQIINKPHPLSATNSEPVSNIWGYAERLKDSNVAATLSKVSTNWSIKAREVWHTRSATSPTNVPVPDSSVSGSDATARSPASLTLKQDIAQWGSLPVIDPTNLYSPPPPRPTYFRPPRDSWAPQDPEQLKSLSLSIPTSPQSESTPPVTKKYDEDTIKPIHSPPSSWSASRMPVSKSAVQRSGPRPLLLPSSLHARTDSSSSIAATRSTSTTPTPAQWQWTDVLRSRIQGRHTESQSSISSVSTADTHDTTNTLSSRGGSRIVRLNRDSVSPIAPPFRKMRKRDSSLSSHSGSDLLSPPPMPYSSLPNVISSRRGSSDGTASTRGWEQVEIPDSPMTSPPLRTPPVYSMDIAKVGSARTFSGHKNSDTMHKIGLTALSISTDTMEPNDGNINPTVLALESYSGPPREEVEDSLKLSPSTVVSESPIVSPSSALSIDTSTSGSPPKLPLSPKIPPRIRSKRYTSQRPPHLRVRDTGDKSPISPNQLTPSPNRSNSTEFDLATTPRAADFLHSSPVNQGLNTADSLESQNSKNEKSSKDKPRTAKFSASTRSKESGTDEGDYESYDELLSAYESESSQPPSDIGENA